MEAKRVAIYVRVSSDKQVDNFSLETQITKCREYISRNNLIEVSLFIEEGESAKTAERTQLNNLLKFIQSNKIDFVLVYKLDRWTRNQADFYSLKTYLTKYKVSLLSATEAITDDPTGQFLEGVFAGLAQLDNELKAIRVKDCLKTKAMDGWFPAKPPFGYLNNPITKQIDIDPRNFESVKLLINEFIQGTSVPDIVYKLNLRGFKTQKGKEWTHRDIWKILERNSKFYSGFYNWGKNYNIEGKHQKMINFEQYSVIQNKLNHKSQQPIFNNNDLGFVLNFELSPSKPFMTCKECGLRVRTCRSKGKLGNYFYYYYCRNSKCTLEKKSWNKTLIENQLEEILKTIKPEANHARYFLQCIEQEFKNQIGEYRVSVNKVKHRLAKLKLEKKSLITMRRNNELSAEDFKSELDDIDRQIITCTSSVNENLIDEERYNNLLQHCELFLTKIEHLYSSFSMQHKQQLLSLIFPDGIYLKNGGIEHRQLANIFYMIEGFKGGKNQMVALQVRESNTSFLEYLDQISLFISRILPQYSLVI